MAEAELLDLRSYDVAFCDGRDPAGYTGDTRTVIDKVAPTSPWLRLLGAVDGYSVPSSGSV